MSDACAGGRGPTSPSSSYSLSTRLLASTTRYAVMLWSAEAQTLSCRIVAMAAMAAAALFTGQAHCAVKMEPRS